MKVSLNSKYSKFTSTIKAPNTLLASGTSVWASFETKLIKAGISISEARNIATQRYETLIASCTKAEDTLD